MSFSVNSATDNKANTNRHALSSQACIIYLFTFVHTLFNVLFMDVREIINHNKNLDEEFMSCVLKPSRYFPGRTEKTT
jgi:hypothetical protein